MRVKKEVRDRFIERLISLTQYVLSNYTVEGYKTLWDMCTDWNSTHDYRDEVMMCEVENDEGEVIGIGIEDVVIYF